VVNYVHGTTVVMKDGRDVLTSLRRVYPLELGLPIEKEALSVTEVLHDAFRCPRQCR